MKRKGPDILFIRVSGPFAYIFLYQLISLSAYSAFKVLQNASMSFYMLQDILQCFKVINRSLDDFPGHRKG